MKLVICLALCLQLCSQLLADPVPEELLSSRCVDSDITVTVDNQLELYIDGQAVTGLKNADTWGNADKVSVPAGTRVIAIKGTDVGVVAGILASGKYYTTGGSWKCTSVHSEHWASPGFNDAAWPAATVIGANGVTPWGYIAGISSDAKWIWTDKHQYGATSDKTVYCRKKPGCRRNTGPTAINSCVGKADGDYQSNKGCHVYATCSNGYLYDARPCAPAPAPGLFWDDKVKRCEWSSTTCTE